MAEDLGQAIGTTKNKIEEKVLIIDTRTQKIGIECDIGNDDGLGGMKDVETIRLNLREDEYNAALAYILTTNSCTNLRAELMQRVRKVVKRKLEKDHGLAENTL